MKTTPPQSKRLAILNEKVMALIARNHMALSSQEENTLKKYRTCLEKLKTSVIRKRIYKQKDKFSTLLTSKTLRKLEWKDFVDEIDDRNISEIEIEDIPDHRSRGSEISATPTFEGGSKNPSLDVRSPCFGGYQDDSASEGMKELVDTKKTTDTSEITTRVFKSIGNTASPLGKSAPLTRDGLRKPSYN